MRKKRRSKGVKKARAAAVDQDSELSKLPHTVIFNRSGVGNYVKRLSRDLRFAFEPFTALNLKFRRKNVLKDVVDIASIFNITNALYFTHSKPKSICSDQENQTESSDGQVMFHVARLPHGPTLTFRVSEYTFIRDILTLIRKIGHRSQYQSPPLLVMQGFKGEGRHIQLMASIFRNMLPPIVLTKVKLKSIRRVILLSREVGEEGAGDSIHFRHYTVRTENKGISKFAKKLSFKKKKVPNLAKYSYMTDFVTKSGMLSDSEMSENEGDEVNEFTAMEEDKFEATVAGKASVKLTEIGPRLTLELIKVEEGLNTGAVLYHRWHVKTSEEVQELEIKLRKKKKLKDKRKAQQEQNRLKNIEKKEEHKQKCLAGMQKSGALPVKKNDDIDDVYNYKPSGASDSDADDESPANIPKSLKRKLKAQSSSAKKQKTSSAPQTTIDYGSKKDDNKKLTIQEVLLKKKQYAKKKKKMKLKKNRSKKGRR